MTLTGHEYAAPDWRSVAECDADAAAGSPWPISADATRRAAAARNAWEYAATLYQDRAA